MTRHLIIFFILTLGLTFCGYGQKKFKIQGSWECYISLSDTVESPHLWFFFDDSNFTTLLVPNYGLPPENVAIDATEKYKLRNDTLKTYSKDGTSIAVISILNNNLISIRSTDSKEKYYLKRVIKK